MAGVRCVTADKTHRCDVCHRLIPVGHKYWKKYKEPRGRDPGIDHREHTNCLQYESYPRLPTGFNKDRASGEKIINQWKEKNDGAV